jgi:N-acetyltransferase 10
MLSGARIVRIATHPDYTRMGYGARAIEALNSFYTGELYNFDDAAEGGGLGEGESFAQAAKVGAVGLHILASGRAVVMTIA